MSKLLPKRIRERREAAGLTINAAAEIAGMHRVAWSDLEAGRRTNPTLETLEKVAGALGVTVAELLTDEDGESVTPPMTVSKLRRAWDEVGTQERKRLEKECEARGGHKFRRLQPVAVKKEYCPDCLSVRDTNPNRAGESVTLDE